MHVFNKKLMKVSELLAMLPRRAQKMSSEDSIYYMNYPIKEDIQAMVQAMFPSYYETSVTYKITFPTMSILSVADNGSGGSTCTVAANSLSDNDMIIITDSDYYNGTHQITNTTATTFDIEVAFDATDTGTATSDYRVTMPTDCVYPLEVQPEKYSRSRIEARDKYDQQPYTISIDDDEIVVPVGSPYGAFQMWYTKEIPLITSVDDDLPYPAKSHRQLVPVLLYGMCLEFFRDRKKANDIQIYLDKYNQARTNIARLSVKSLF